MAIPEFLSGGGEMGQRIRDFDWSATPLGPVDTWPQSLRTCIRIMLTSRQPIWIGWGKQLIKFYNDPYKAIVGGKHPRALGQPASLVWKDIWKDIGPMLQAVMEKDEGTYRESQLLIMERNGYPEETYYTFSYTPIPGDDGSTAGMICANSDDTEKIIGERQLRTLMQLGKRLTDLQSSQDVIDLAILTLKDNPHDFPFVQFRMAGEEGTLATDCRLAAGYRKPQIVDDLVGKAGDMTKGVWEIMPHKGIILPVFQSGKLEAFGFLVVGLNPYRLPDEKYTGFFSLTADQITNSLSDLYALDAERKKAAALWEIDRAKTTFFSNISHEFRTPLTLLLGPIEDVLNDPKSEDINKYRMGVAYRNVLRMQKLVNTLLDFSRIEAGRMEGQYVLVDICALTRDLASSFRSAVERAGMELTISCGPVTDDVYVDIDQWERIILNLVSNAFKYSQEGSIAVHVEQAGREIQVRVSDTGMGIAEEQLGLIFDRFHRIESVQGRSQEGTGIGLAMVKELVKLHQGTITVTSTPGVGSEFTVTIPVGKDHLAANMILVVPGGQAAVNANGPAPLKHTESFVAEALKWLPEAPEDTTVLTGGDYEAGFFENIGARAGGTVLLADDNADMREYVQRLLSAQFTVITAVNGEDAFLKVLEYQPDLLLSDIMMPVMDGFGLLEKVRSHPVTKHTPVIFLSARAGDEAKIEGLDAGADDYLVKPFSAKELLARVDANIRIARSRTEHAGRLEEEVRVRTRELRELNVQLEDLNVELKDLNVELKDLNISLQKSNDDLQQFAHVASHDLKEPVRKIRTFSSRLRDEYGAELPGQARVFLNKIEQATSRMYSMIEGVLAYSILNGSEQTIEPLDLNVIFSNIEIDLEVTISEKRASLIRGKLPQIDGASVLIYQLFYNLINNSLKFARAGVPPVIEVVAELLQVEDSAEVMTEITLTDNGIGFDQEHTDRIFDTFARLHTKDKYEGTGLGLALCRKIVERHQGSIRAAGEKNRGAVFVIRLPLVQHRNSL